MKKTSIIFSKLYLQSLYILIEASIYRQHKNSFLGSAWSLLQPFIHILIISFIFSFLLKQPTEKLVINLVATLPLWSFITSSVVSSTKSLIERSMILKKVYIHKTLLPITDVLVHCYTLAYSFVAMYTAFVIIYPANFSFSVLFSPIAMAPLILSVIFIGIVLAYLTPYIMDIPQMITVLLNVIYWALPVVYPYSMVPEDKKWVFIINPLFHLIRPMQILLEEKSFPNIFIMLNAVIVTILIGLISFLIVKKVSKNVVYYL